MYHNEVVLCQSVIEYHELDWIIMDVQPYLTEYLFSCIILLFRDICAKGGQLNRISNSYNVSILIHTSDWLSVDFFHLNTFSPKTELNSIA